jgi:hypothetical protein
LIGRDILRCTRIKNRLELEVADVVVHRGAAAICSTANAVSVPECAENVLTKDAAVERGEELH